MFDNNDDDRVNIKNRSIVVPIMALFDHSTVKKFVTYQTNVNWMEKYGNQFAKSPKIIACKEKQLALMKEKDDPCFKNLIPAIQHEINDLKYELENHQKQKAKAEMQIKNNAISTLIPDLPNQSKISDFIATK